MTVNELLFNDIGVKIQRVAKVIVWIYIVISFVGGVSMFFVGIFDFRNSFYLALLSPVAVLTGCLYGWLSVIILYGFGKLVADVEELKEKNNMAINSPVTAKDTPAFTAEDKHKKAYQCECGTIYHGMFCPVCGAGRSKKSGFDVKLAERAKGKMVFCDCGNHYYGKVCPVCGRENRNH